MSTSTNAILAYGYNLGGGEPWEIREATGEYGEIELDWYDPDGDDDFITACWNRLLASIGHTGEWAPGDDTYYQRERAAEAALGVEVETYCSDGYPMYILAAHVITVRRGDIDALDLDALKTDPAEHGWDTRLASALAALGITPTQDRPRWLLASYWG